jgi:hypothetical protein
MRTFALVAALATIFPLATAFGAEPEPSEDMKAAMGLFDEGVKLMHQKDYEHARLKFLAASALNKDKSAHNLFDLAFCEFHSSHFVEATQHLRKYVHHPDADPTHVSEANALLPKALSHVGQIQISAAGSTARVDGGEEYGATALVEPIAVTPGRHHVEAYSGALHVAQDVDVAQGQTVTVSPSEPPPSPLPKPPENVSVSAPTQEERGIDQGLVTPPPSTGTFTTGRKVAIGIGVAAVAVAGVGIGFGVGANNAGSNAASLRAGTSDTSCTALPNARCSSLQSANSTAQTDANVATGLFIGGGVLAVTALAVWLFSPPHATRVGAHLVPQIDRTGAGLRLVGEF